MGTLLLRSEVGEGLHEWRAQGIVGFQPERLELGADLIQLVLGEAVLRNGGHESRELGLLPSLLAAQLGVDKVESLEGVVLLDASVHMCPAVFACVTQNGGFLIDNLELVAVGSHRDLVDGDDGDEREQSSLGLPACAAATSVLV